MAFAVGYSIGVQGMNYVFFRSFAEAMRWAIANPKPNLRCEACKWGSYVCRVVWS